ncbi:MAG TPA: hypothetical protein DEQ09_07175 [Bacteroidales bacterium]|nr:hypothetical protein [Bacteroidales bacterium]
MDKKIPNLYKMIIRLNLVIIVFLSITLNSLSQTYYFDSYGVSEGLSSSKVYDIIQDKNDYLWLATESGVTRWNGSVFENFSSDDGLATGGVIAIYEDQTGRIWMGHLNGGLSCYENKSFRQVSIDTFEITGDITGITEHNNKLWITTAYNGALAADIPEPGADMLKVTQYRGAQGLSDQVSGLYIDAGNILYCIADLGIKKYNADADNFEPYRPEGLTTYFNTIAMLEDSKGGKWFGTYHGGLYYFPPGNEELIVYDARDGLADNWISCITEDSSGKIWVGTFGGGITVFDNGEMITYNDRNGLPSLQIQSIMEDREGNIIIASHTSGIHVYKGSHFVNYISENIFRNNKNVWAITEDKYNRYWFGTNEGIILYDPEIGLPWSYHDGTHNIANHIRYIVNDKDHNLWIGTNDRGVYRYDYNKNDFVYNYKLNDILPSLLMVTAMTVDHENNLWIGTSDGVAVWNIAENSGNRYTQSNGLAGRDIKSLFVDKEGCIWIGSEQAVGLTKYEPALDTFKIVNLDYDLPPTSITQTDDGTIWLGTQHGVIALKDDTIAIHLTENDGLLSNNIKLLEPDGKVALYIGTNRGLNRYDIEEKTINTYTEANGFVGIETMQNASFLDSNGQLWFGTANGATRLVPGEIPPPDTDPLTHIKGMRVNFETRAMSSGMRLKYTEKNLTFDYYSVCLTNPDAVRYQVMLEGADPGWRPETDQTTAIFSSLSPGRYTFKVKAQNSDGVWNKEPVTFDFVIRPPFYESPWFIISVVIVLAFAVVAYIKIRERNLVREKKILEEKVEVRTAEVVQKSMVIEEKNRDITASIRYAERIQMAMLPPEDSFDDTFVLFLPKDIVSGDFYWMHDNGDIQFIAAVDCTGHGVPGAFMSIIGYNSLTKIVREYGITRPAAILDQLNVEVSRSLIQRGDEVISDGMDMALLAYDKKHTKLEFAGAYNPLVIVRDSEIITIKGDRFPIGMATAREKKFKNVKVDIQSGDNLYVFSDGYSDQFGGPEGKKFKVVNLKKELLKVSPLSMTQQKEGLLKTLDEWMGEQNQIDDILVIGTKVP